jgi:hypothetical protein
MPIIFHYDFAEKFFLGTEDISDLPEGVGIPACSTEIPPPAFSKGFIPVFDGEKWIIVNDEFFHPTCIEINYDAGRLMATYRPIDLFYGADFPCYPSIAQISSSALTAMGICDRFKLVQKKLDQIVKLHIKFMQNEPLSLDEIIQSRIHAINPGRFAEIKLEGETMIFLMRRVLDSLIQLTYLLTNQDDFKKSLQIKISELGKVLKQPTTPLAEIILGRNGYEPDHTNFLEIINSLFNSFKHCLMHEDSRVLMGNDFPTVVSYYAKHNNFKSEIEYHNHNIFHLVMGFQDCVTRILRNQKAYLNNINMIC